MNNTDIRQRLTAILATDASGYSRLITTDEASTVKVLDSTRNIFKSQIESHQKRVIDITNDSILTVFETAAGTVTTTKATNMTPITINILADMRMNPPTSLYRINPL